MAQILTTTTTSNPMKMSPLIDPHATKSTKYTQVISKFGKHVPTKPAPGKVSPTSTKIGVWDLKSQEFTELEAPESTESLFNGILDTESVIGIDGRKAIPKKHYAPGGKYRGQYSPSASHPSSSIFAQRCLLNSRSTCQTLPTICRAARRLILGYGNRVAYRKRSSRHRRSLCLRLVPQVRKTYPRQSLRWVFRQRLCQGHFDGRTSHGHPSRVH
jgi:hypothetical protein